MSRLIICAVLLLLAQVSFGAYITDKLLAGFYAAPDLTIEPLRALPNDTPMEILEEAGNLSRVRLGDNSEGWVETRFITKEKPARMMLLELQAKYASLKRQADNSAGGQQVEMPAATPGEPATQQRPDSFQPWLLPLIMLGMLFSFISGIAFKNYQIAKRARQSGPAV